MVTWAGLLTAIVARYGFGYDGELFFVAGLSHGIIFLGYAAAAVIVGMNQRWSVGVGFMAITSAIIPFATLPFDRYLHKKNLLDGPWRYEAGDHPRDNNPIDRLFRWFLRHPRVMTITIVGLLGGLLVVALLAGSPREWGN
jgi:integral membrane protein